STPGLSRSRPVDAVGARAASSRPGQPPSRRDNEGMPKISAPTVAEHRAAQRAALVQAGEAVLIESGLGAVRPGAVCERAGLSRSSFYDYFSTRDDLLVAIAIDAMERWDTEVEQAL